jgi:hypothetical protein
MAMCAAGPPNAVMPNLRKRQATSLRRVRLEFPCFDIGPALPLLLLFLFAENGLAIEFPNLVFLNFESLTTILGQ